jgi:hypothetical protein
MNAPSSRNRPHGGAKSAADGRNVGLTDRIVRLVVGAVLLGFALACPFAQAQGPAVVWISGIVGAVLAVTGALGICPIYRLTGMSTARR